MDALKTLEKDHSFISQGFQKNLNTPTFQYLRNLGLERLESEIETTKKSINQEKNGINERAENKKKLQETVFKAQTQFSLAVGFFGACWGLSKYAGYAIFNSIFKG